jgi:hypothetical protein
MYMKRNRRRIEKGFLNIVESAAVLKKRTVSAVVEEVTQQNRTVRISTLTTN